MDSNAAAHARACHEWREGCNYISLVTSLKGRVRAMNHDRATFVRYCEMKRDEAERAGFPDVASYIQHCLDDLTS